MPPTPPQQPGSDRADIRRYHYQEPPWIEMLAAGVEKLDRASYMLDNVQDCDDVKFFIH